MWLAIYTNYCFGDILEEMSKYISIGASYTLGITSVFLFGLSSILYIYIDL